MNRDLAGAAGEALVSDGCLSVKEAAKLSGLSTGVLYRAMAEARIPTSKLASGGVIPRNALRTFLADRLILK